MKKVVVLLTIVIAAAAVPQALAATVQVSVTRVGFVPDPVTISVGDTVTWTNADTRDRQVVSTAAGFASPVLRPGDRFSHTFGRAGRFAYEDPLVRPRDRGTITVRAAGAAVTLAASRLTVTYGAATTLSGTISTGESGEKVTILAQACGRNFQRVADATTTTNGAFSLSVKPTDNTAYRAEFKGDRSATLTVKVRPRIRLGKVAPRRYNVRVTAAASFAGKVVAFQRFNAATRRWVRVRLVTLASTNLGVPPTVVSARTFTARVRSRTRVRIVMGQLAAGSCYLASRSNVILA